MGCTFERKEMRLGRRFIMVGVLCTIAALTAYVCGNPCDTSTINCARCNDEYGCGNHLVVDADGVPMGCRDTSGQCTGSCYKCTEGTRRDFCRLVQLTVTCTLTGSQINCGKESYGDCTGMYGRYPLYCNCTGFTDPTTADCKMCQCSGP